MSPPTHLQFAKKMATSDEVMPRIVLIPHARSHPFAQRDCVLKEPLKVGRPVDKKRISQNNLIFDCRVLSRNHALIWFENGMFYIQDTKSSNGTFVNECRLSPSGEESAPVEMKTRDVIQFGVNVNVEKKVTHGCIIATVKLFVNEKELPGPDPDIQQVLQVIQTSLHKEQELENKLVNMQEVLIAAHTLAKESMISIVKEDELLSRLEMLENQLHVYTRNVGDDELRKQLKSLLEEKHDNELSSKEKIRSLLQERIDCNTKLSQLQRDYDKAEEECQKYRTLYEALKHEHSQQIYKLSEQLKTVEKEKTELKEKMKEEMDSISDNSESLQEQLDITKKDLENLKSRMKDLHEQLVQAKIEVDMARQKGFLSNEDMGINYVHNEGTESHTTNLHGNESEKVNENVLITITPSLMNEYTGEDSVTDTNEAQDKKLEDELQFSDQKEKQSSLDFGSSKNNLLRQLKDLQNELETESRVKTELQDSVESQTKKLTEMQAVVQQQRQEIDKLRAVTSLELLDLPNDMDQCKANLSRISDVPQQLKSRDEELIKVDEEKERLQTRLTGLEIQYEKMLKESRLEQSELIKAQIETKSLTEKLTNLQETLAGVKDNSNTPSISPEVTLIKTSSDPLSSHPDPRLKILSLITLASITVAVISLMIAYLF